MDLALEIRNEFAEDYNELLGESKYSFDNTIKKTIAEVEMQLGTELSSLSQYPSSILVLNGLISDLYESRKGRKNRLIDGAKKKVGLRSEEMVGRIEKWNGHPNEILLIKFPLVKETASHNVIYNSFKSDIKLFSYLKLKDYMVSTQQHLFSIPEFVQGMVSVASKTPILPSHTDAVSIQTSTIMTQYPSIINLHASIDEKLLDKYMMSAVQESVYKHFTTLDLKVLGFVCNKLKLQLLDNQLEVQFNAREAVEKIFERYRSEYQEQVLSSIIKLTILTIAKDGILMRFLSNYSLTNDEDSNVMVSTSLDSFLAKQIKKNQIMRLDENLYKILTNDMSQILILPIQTHRVKEYLSQKNKKLSHSPIKIDWPWVMKNLSVPVNTRPAATMKRIEVALNEMVKKNILIAKFTNSGNTYYAYPSDISTTEAEFIQRNYSDSDFSIKESLQIFTE